MVNLTEQFLECLIGALRGLGDKYPRESEEAETFYDAADALDDALALIEDLNNA